MFAVKDAVSLTSATFCLVMICIDVVLATQFISSFFRNSYFVASLPPRTLRPSMDSALKILEVKFYAEILEIRRVRGVELRLRRFTCNLDRAMRFRDERGCDTAELKSLKSTAEPAPSDED